MISSGAGPDSAAFKKKRRAVEGQFKQVLGEPLR
jgi:hypothetical protein